MSRKIKFGTAIALIVVAFVYLLYAGFEAGSMYYLTVGELIDRQSQIEGKRVRINGNIVAGSVTFDPADLKLSFLLKDEESDEALSVYYYGAPPDLLEDDGVSIVAEGYYDPGENSFDAKTLLVKCPSKYESQYDE